MPLYVKKPGKKHPGFRLIDETGKTRRFAEVDAINAEVRAGRLPAEQAAGLVRAFRDSLRPKGAPRAHGPNEELALAWWEEVGRWKERRRPRAAKDRLLWAVRQLAGVPLLTASLPELAQALQARLGAAGRRRAVPPLNLLRAWKELPGRLDAPKAPLSEPPYLRAEEVAAAARLLPQPDRALVFFLAASGCRLGEAYAATRFSLRGKTHVYLDKQRLRGWELEGTKNGKVGAALLIPAHKKEALAWLDVGAEEREALRRSGRTLRRWKAVTLKALGRSCCLHWLRHSYANYWLEKGASIEDLVRWMRDRASTIEASYASWLKDEKRLEEEARRWKAR